MPRESGSIVPQGESLRRAVKWLSAKREEEPKAPRQKLIDEAALRFDLSPMEAEFLQRNFESQGQRD